MELDFALKILALIALVAFIILAIVSLISLSSAIKLMREANYKLNDLAAEFQTTMKSFSENIAQAKSKFNESLHNFDDSSKQLTATTRSIQKRTDSIGNAVDSYSKLLNKVHNRISKPLLDASVYVGAAAKAVSTFSSFFGGSKKESKKDK